MALDQALAGDAAPETKALRRVIDADSHLDPPHEMWREYLPAQFRDRAPYIEAGEDHDWVVFEGKRRPLRMVNNTAGKAFKEYKEFARRADMREVWRPETRLADMDADGISAAVLFGGGPLGTTDPELYIASFEAYNRWLWDFCGVDRKRLAGVAYLPVRDLDETIGLMRQAAKLGHRTINIPAFPQARDGVSTVARIEAIATGQVAALTGDPSGGRSYAHAEFDRLWAEVQDLDLTVTVHLGGRVPRFGNKEHFLPDMPMSKLAMAEPIGILIFGCVFDRFPKLRFATIESGVGWFAWAAEYMDRTWERQRFWIDSRLADKPSFYWDRNIFGSFIQDRAGILMRDLPGAGNIMWSSDYPHSETTFPHSHAIIDRDFEGVPEAAVREIVCRRAARLYGFD